MTKTVFKLLVLVSGVFILHSCGMLASSPKQTVKREIRNYDWTPPSTAPARSSEVTLILINPTYMKGFEDANEPTFVKFRENMATDFEELLVARGYSIRGPFNTYDEIVYRDKQDADLIMEVQIKFNSEAEQGTLKRSYNALASSMRGVSVYKYYLDGTIILDGKLNITLKEPSTEEKLWVKSVPIKKQRINVKTAKYPDKKGVFQDTNLLNSVETALNESYQSAMNLAWKYLEPAELKQLKAQVKAIRKKKTY